MERRRRATWVDRLMLGLLGLFVIATLGPALVGAVTLLDVNLLTRGDTVDGYLPSIAEIRSRLFRGDFPAG